MNDLLRRYILEVLNNPRIKSSAQVMAPGSSRGHKKEEESEMIEDEIEEMSGAGAVAGFTAPLGYSSEEVKGPGAGPKKKKKSSARWK